MYVYENSEVPYFEEFDNKQDAIKALKGILDAAKMDGCEIIDQSRDEIEEHNYIVKDGKALEVNRYWIPGKVNGGTITDRTTPIKRSVSKSFSTQNNNVMANSKGLKIGTRKNGSAVYGTAKVSKAYRATGTKNKKPAMVVPVGYVTLPSPFYTFGRKHHNLGKLNGNERIRTYVIGATMTKNGKKLYVVAQLTYMGGKPAVAENRYKGYSRYTAWSVFNEIPYTTKDIKDANGKWKRTTGDGTTASAVKEAIAQRKAIATARSKK